MIKRHLLIAFLAWMACGWVMAKGKTGSTARPPPTAKPLIETVEKELVVFSQKIEEATSEAKTKQLEASAFLAKPAPSLKDLIATTSNVQHTADDSAEKARSASKVTTQAIQSISAAVGDLSKLSEVTRYKQHLSDAQNSLQQAKAHSEQASNAKEPKAGQSSAQAVQASAFEAYQHLQKLPTASWRDPSSKLLVQRTLQSIGKVQEAANRSAEAWDSATLALESIPKATKRLATATDAELQLQADKLQRELDEVKVAQEWSDRAFKTGAAGSAVLVVGGAFWLIADDSSRQYRAFFLYGLPSSAVEPQVQKLREEASRWRLLSIGSLSLGAVLVGTGGALGFLKGGWGLHLPGTKPQDGHVYVTLALTPSSGNVQVSF